MHDCIVIVRGGVAYIEKRNERDNYRIGLLDYDNIAATESGPTAEEKQMENELDAIDAKRNKLQSVSLED